MNMSDIAHYTITIWQMLTLKDLIILWLFLCCIGLTGLLLTMFRICKDAHESVEFWQARYNLIKGVRNDRF